MKRRTWSRNIADWLSGTRELTKPAYALYDELCHLIVDGGGRLKLDRDKIMRKLSYRDHRSFRRPYDELIRLGKIVEHAGWLYQVRLLIDHDHLATAVAHWGLSRAVLAGMGVDADALAAALDRAAPVEDVDKYDADLFSAAVNNSANAPNHATVGGQSPDSSRTRGEKPSNINAPPKKWGDPSTLYLRESSTERTSSWPRARGGERGGQPAPRATGPPSMRLGEGWVGSTRPPATGTGRSIRPETAQAKLLLVLLHELGWVIERANAMIDAAEDPAHPNNAQAARILAQISRKFRCGYYPPADMARRRAMN